MVLKLNLIVAACENMGIGKNNNLPWRLKTEMEYFTRMTSQTVDPDKKNVVIMGRKTWDSIPPKFKPLNNRINFVLSRSNITVERYENVYCFNSLEQALDKLKDDEFKKQYEAIWVIGGSYIYKEAIQSHHFYRLYLTKIMKEFECDTFLPPFGDNLKQISLPDIPETVQEENGIQFVYTVFENTQFSSNSK